MTLRDEILSRPDCADALAIRDCGALAALLSTGRTKLVMTPIADLQAYLQGNGLWWSIKAVAGDPANPAYQAAQALMDVANARYENIDMSLPIVDQMLGALVDAGIMPQASADALKEMAIAPDPYSVQDVINSMGW